MKIFAINSSNYGLKSASFKGISIHRDSRSDGWDYYGSKSSSSIDGHYVGSNDEDIYTYHPFLGESEERIKEEIRKGNFSSDYATMGLGGGYSMTTTRGKTIPYTQKEWNRLSTRDQERIKSLL